MRTATSDNGRHKARLSDRNLRGAREKGDRGNSKGGPSEGGTRGAGHRMQEGPAGSGLEVTRPRELGRRVSVQVKRGVGSREKGQGGARKKATAFLPGQGRTANERAR